jgi:hypothetical protein
MPNDAMTGSGQKRPSAARGKKTTNIALTLR